jgi:hypothetical protein
VLVHLRLVVLIKHRNMSWLRCGSPLTGLHRGSGPFGHPLSNEAVAPAAKRQDQRRAWVYVACKRGYVRTQGVSSIRLKELASFPSPLRFETRKGPSHSTQNIAACCGRFVDISTSEDNCVKLSSGRSCLGSKHLARKFRVHLHPGGPSDQLCLIQMRTNKT